MIVCTASVLRQTARQTRKHPKASASCRAEASNPVVASSCGGLKPMYVHPGKRSTFGGLSTARTGTKDPNQTKPQTSRDIFELAYLVAYTDIISLACTLQRYRQLSLLLSATANCGSASLASRCCSRVNHSGGFAIAIASLA